MIALDKKGFSSKRTLSTLNADLIRTEFKTLKIAQMLLLEDAVESLQTAPVNKEQEKLNSGQSLDVSDILGIIAPASTDHAAESSGKPAMFDPLSFNISNANIAAGAKFRDIRDFISVCARNQKVPDEDPFGTIKVGQVELSLKESKSPLEKVNISKYMEGSLRILRAMAIEDKADLGHVLEYVNYLIKFATLAQSFQWQSLLKYDLAYRKGQSEMSFTWGADSAYLMQLHLKALGHYGGNATQVSDRHKGTYRGHITPKDRMVGLKTKYDPHSGKVVCHKFNGRQGCDLRGCKFAHVCATCFKNHPDFGNHVKSTTASQSNSTD